MNNVLRPNQAILLSAMLLGVVVSTSSADEERAMTYRVSRADQPIPTDAKWDSPSWREVEPLELRHFMGEKPKHFPRVRAKLAYDDKALYVIFDVKDQYVRAVAQQHQGAVFQDSCVELFFTPGNDVAAGYFNLEMNCGGTMLLHYQRVPRKNSLPWSKEHLARIEVAHSLPKIVEPEIDKPTDWTVAYRLPLELLGKYFPGQIAQPAPGVVWRANVYKCADDTSHPHWLTWSPVEFKRPDFHRPDQFGTLVFE